MNLGPLAVPADLKQTSKENQTVTNNKTQNWTQMMADTSSAEFGLLPRSTSWASCIHQ